MTPDGRTLYVLATDDSTITPVSIATGITGSPIRVAGAFARANPTALVITPDGRTLYVANQGNNTVAVILAR